MRRVLRDAITELPLRRRALLTALFDADIAREHGLPIASIGPTRARLLSTLRNSLNFSGIAA